MTSQGVKWGRQCCKRSHSPSWALGVLAPGALTPWLGAWAPQRSRSDAHSLHTLVMVREGPGGLWGLHSSTKQQTKCTMTKCSKKLKRQIIMWYSNPTSGYIHRRIESRIPKRYWCVHLFCSLHRQAGPSAPTGKPPFLCNKHQTENTLFTHHSNKHWSLPSWDILCLK